MKIMLLRFYLSQWGGNWVIRKSGDKPFCEDKILNVKTEDFKVA